MPECAKPNIGHLRLQGVDGYWEPWLSALRLVALQTG